jgi:hypothetical protein
VNSYLNGALPGAWFSQIARLARVDSDASGNTLVSLQASLPGSVALDRARLLYVDHPADATAIATSAGIVVTHPQPLAALSDDAGGDWLAALSAATAEGHSLVVPAGSSLTASWVAADGYSGLAIDCAHLGEGWGDGAGVDVQVMVSGAWQTVDHVNPRRSLDVIGAVVPATTTARLIFLADAQIRSVRGFVASPAATQQPGVSMLEAAASDRPGGASALAEADGIASTLGVGEAITMTFPTMPPEVGLARAFFLDLRASYTPPTGAWSARLHPVSSEVPARFALMQNRPNPFMRATTFRFDVPRRTHVLLEIFDAQGRRVSSLVNQNIEPGTHSYEWDARDVRGGLLGPGVYLYRMSAGDFRAQRRLVLLAR